jgi:hypothetical protein
MIWKRVAVVTIWNVLVMGILAIFGQHIIGLNYDQFLPLSQSADK